MSSAIIVNFDKPTDTELLGFSKYNEHTLFHIGYKNFSLYGYILLQREKEYILKFFLISVVISNLSKKIKRT